MWKTVHTLPPKALACVVMVWKTGHIGGIYGTSQPYGGSVHQLNKMTIVSYCSTHFRKHWWWHIHFTDWCMGFLTNLYCSWVTSFKHQGNGLPAVTAMMNLNNLWVTIIVLFGGIHIMGINFLLWLELCLVKLWYYILAISKVVSKWALVSGNNGFRMI